MLEAETQIDAGLSDAPAAEADDEATAPGAGAVAAVTEATATEGYRLRENAALTSRQALGAARR